MSAARFFIQDISASFNPYTFYAYYLEVTNGAGTTRSLPTIILTPESIPTGLQPPTIQALGPRQVTLTWSGPSRPNGVITIYSLSINDTFLQNFTTPVLHNISHLQPDTAYAISLLACNSAGCVTAPLLIANTAEASPEGVSVPLARVLSASAVQITWQPPLKPNGKLIEFRVFSNDSRVAAVSQQPTARSVDITGLAPFTRYLFILVACTAAGCTQSSPTPTVQTLEAPPQGLRSPTLLALTSRTVDIAWLSPSFPNGVISGYKIYRNNSLVANASSSSLSFIDSGLEPNTHYIYYIVAENGAGVVQSPPSSVQTPEDTPENVLAPIVTALNASAFRATLPSPGQPNGVIIKYTIIVDSLAMSLGLQQTVVLKGFTPFSLHTFRLEVCTAKGCALSQAVTARTAQAPAEGVPSPNATALNASSVLVEWTAPTIPNGIIAGYGLERRLAGVLSHVPDQVAMELANETDFKHIDGGLRPFTEYEYRVVVVNGAGFSPGDWTMVRTGEAPPGGVDIQALVPLQRSVTLAWGLPLQPNGVIIGYKVYIRTIVTSAGTLISSVGAGDFNTTVLQLTPFTLYEFRLSAENSAGRGDSAWRSTRTLEDRPEQLQPIVVAERTSDGMALNLTWNPPLSPNGIITEYFVYSDRNTLEYQGSANHFFLRRLTPFTTYNVRLRACTSVGCADGSTQTVQSAEVAPSSLSPPTTFATSSRSVLVTWQSPILTNGIIIRYAIYRRLASDSDQTGTLVHQQSPPRTFSFVDVSSLQPYTEYQYRVEAANSAGTATSNFSQPVRTSADSPEGVAMPAISIVDAFTVRLSWTTPQRPNGLLLGYDVLRNGTLVASRPASSLMYTDSSLQPYTVYSYRLRVCTHMGNCTTGMPTLGRTLQTSPTGVSSPRLQTVNGTAIQARWLPPSQANGVIQRYDVIQGEPCTLTRPSLPRCTVFSGTSTSTVIHFLEPNTQYTFLVQACTVAGCTNSSVELVKTPEGAPEGVPPPHIDVIGQNQVKITVYPPSKPNGVLRRYDLLRNGTTVAFRNDSLSLLSTAFQIVDGNLEPDTTYVYSVVALTGGGSSESDETTAITHPPPPDDVRAPNVTAISPTSLFIAWDEPETLFTPVLYYLLYHNATLLLNSTQQSTTVTGLLPYTAQTFYISACSQYGCTPGNTTTDRTLEAPPAGLAIPALTIPFRRQINVVWRIPSQPNGIILDYIVRRRLQNQGAAAVITNVSVVASPTTFYTDTGLSAVTGYEYSIRARNSAGSVDSSWVGILTGEDAPEGVKAPELRLLMPTYVEVFLPEPDRPNGLITSYELFVNGSFASGQILNQHGNATGLQPDTVYALTASVCTRVGCSPSASSLVVTTPESLPLFLAPPALSEATPTGAQARWSSPAEPNGVIIRYGAT